MNKVSPTGSAGKEEGVGRRGAQHPKSEPFPARSFGQLILWREKNAVPRRSLAFFLVPPPPARLCRSPASPPSRYEARKRVQEKGNPTSDGSRRGRFKEGRPRRLGAPTSASRVAKRRYGGGGRKGVRFPRRKAARPGPGGVWSGWAAEPASALPGRYMLSSRVRAAPRLMAALRAPRACGGYYGLRPGRGWLRLRLLLLCIAIATTRGGRAQVREGGRGGARWGGGEQ